MTLRPLRGEGANGVKHTVMKAYLWTTVLLCVVETLKEEEGVLETKKGQANYLGQAGKKGEVLVDLKKNKDKQLTLKL